MTSTHTDELVVNALVKLRQRIAGEEVRLTQAEAQALYLAVLPQAGRVGASGGGRNLWPGRHEGGRMSKTTTPTMLAAEEAARIIGLDVFDLAVALRRFAVDELELQTALVRRGDERPNLGRFRRLLRAAEACEAAWDETLAETLVAAGEEDEPDA